MFTNLLGACRLDPGKLQEVKNKRRIAYIYIVLEDIDHYPSSEFYLNEFHLRS
jgi:hypothetical protein